MAEGEDLLVYGSWWGEGQSCVRSAALLSQNYSASGLKQKQNCMHLVTELPLSSGSHSSTVGLVTAVLNKGFQALRKVLQLFLYFTVEISG